MINSNSCLPEFTLVAGKTLVRRLRPLPLDHGAVDDLDVAAQIHLVERPEEKIFSVKFAKSLNESLCQN